MLRFVCMSPKNNDLFPDLLPFAGRRRSPPRVLMHISDVGEDNPESKPVCKMKCVRCGMETDWTEFDTVTEAKRGIPCKPCNEKRSAKRGVK